MKTREVPAVGDYENPTVTDLATISLRPSPAEVELDRIPDLLGEIKRLGPCCRPGYAAGGGSSVTTKWWSTPLRVAGCTVGWIASR